MRTVTGRGSLQNPVSGEDSLRVEQLNYFEKVLENSMPSWVERLEQLRKVGRRATRPVSTAAENGWIAAQRIILQKHRAREEPIKLLAADHVDRNDHAKRDDDVFVERFNASSSMTVMESPCAVREHHEVRQVIVTNLLSSTKVHLNELIQERRCNSAGTTLGVSAGRIKPRDSSTRRATDM